VFFTSFLVVPQEWLDLSGRIALLAISALATQAAMLSGLARRLHDVGLPGWPALVYLAPALLFATFFVEDNEFISSAIPVLLGMGLLCFLGSFAFFLRGQAGANRYGEPTA